jgi:very-short-patch-repair endonuclease
MKELLPMFHDASGLLFEYAITNRKNATKAEHLLWERLKNKQLEGHKFRRQHPIGRFILDFYCYAAKLAIEIDGDYHEKPLQKEYDEQRTGAIETIDIQVIRFTNEEVLNDMEGVLAEILSVLRGKIPE